MEFFKTEPWEKYKYVFHNMYSVEVIFKKKQQDFFTSKKINMRYYF